MAQILSTTTWGHPAATKHVLLIHDLGCSSQMWYRIASEFASRGYFVTAPDLLGHGQAARSSTYAAAAYTEALLPLFQASGDGHPYDIVVGHSLGGLIACHLFPALKLKSTRPVQVILVDPALELPPEAIVRIKTLIGNQLRNPKSPDAYLQENPHWPKEDAIFRSLGVHLCDVATVEGTFDHNSPWSFKHLLDAVPDNVKVTVLAADPSKAPAVKEEDFKPYPHVIAKTVWGASHLIPVDAPDVIIKTALEAVGKVAEPAE